MEKIIVISLSLARESVLANPNATFSLFLTFDLQRVIFDEH